MFIQSLLLVLLGELFINSCFLAATNIFEIKSIASLKTRHIMLGMCVAATLGAAIAAAVDASLLLLSSTQTERIFFIIIRIIIITTVRHLVSFR